METTEASDHQGEPLTRLRLRDVSVRLGAFVLEGIDLDVGLGEVVGLLGHNGCGKSTTFRIIADVVRPARGSVTVDGFDHRLDEREFKRRVCFVGDNKGTFPKSRVSEALAFAAALYPRWDQAWCDDLCDQLFLPTDTEVEHLSTGMHTKLALVLALSARPSFLMLDEPTSGLDIESQQLIWKIIGNLSGSGEIGVLVSSHSADEVEEHCTRIVALENGAIREQLIPHGWSNAANVLRRSHT